MMKANILSLMLFILVIAIFLKFFVIDAYNIYNEHNSYWYRGMDIPRPFWPQYWRRLRGIPEPMSPAEVNHSDDGGLLLGATLIAASVPVVAVASYYLRKPNRKSSRTPRDRRGVE